MFNRNKIIETLVFDDLELLDASELLTNGFKGYANFTDEELIEECESRDISYLFGEED